jgi:hypothetical protein
MYDTQQKGGAQAKNETRYERDHGQNPVHAYLRSALFYLFQASAVNEGANTGDRWPV